MHKGWNVLFGCDEWQDGDTGLAPEKARERYEEIKKTPPCKGGYCAVYVILQDEHCEAIDTDDIGSNNGH